MTYWNTDIVTYILTQFQRTLSPLKERVQKNTKKKVEVVRIIFSMLFFNPNIWWTLKHSPSSLQVNRIASCSRVLRRRMGFAFIKIRKKSSRQWQNHSSIKETTVLYKCSVHMCSIKSCSEEFSNIHMKTPVPEFIF